VHTPCNHKRCFFMPAFSAKLPSYLFKDPRTNIFYLRFRYNKKLAAELGSAEFKRSLRTKDRDSARFLAGYIYRLIKDRLREVGNMDRKWAGVYLKELYQRLLQRGQVALSSEDSLSFHWHTDQTGQVHIPPEPTPRDINESQSHLFGHPYQETFADFQAWTVLQSRLAEADSETDRARLMFEFDKARKVVAGQLASRDDAEADVQTGLDRDSDSHALGKDGKPVLGAYSFEHHQAIGLPHQTGTEQQKKLYSSLKIGAPISEPEFSKLLFKMQSDLFGSLSAFQQQVNDRTADTESVMETVTDSVLTTDAHDVTTHLEAYRDTVRELGLAREMEATGKTEQELLDESTISEEEYLALLAEDQQPEDDVRSQVVTLPADETEGPIPFVQNYKDYVDEKKLSVGDSSISQYEDTLEWVIEHYGEAIDCREVNKKFASSMQRKLIKKFSNDTKGAEEKTIKSTTANKYIGNLRGFFDWLDDHTEFFADKKNPFEGLRIKENEDLVESYLPYSNEEMQQILNYQPKKTSSGSIADSRNIPEAAYWMPKVAAYTGMRINEIAELNLEDVSYSDGNGWVISVADKRKQKGGRRASMANKTRSAIRYIPMHRKLVDIGFVDFVERHKSERKPGRLFVELFEGKTKMPKSGWGEPVSRWFNGRLLVNLGLKKERVVFHSLRTTVANHFIARGVNFYVANQLIGHYKGYPDMDNKSTLTTSYGKGARTDYDVLKEVMESVSYD
jgi:integrase